MTKNFPVHLIGKNLLKYMESEDGVCSNHKVQTVKVGSEDAKKKAVQVGLNKLAIFGIVETSEKNDDFVR